MPGDAPVSGATPWRVLAENLVIAAVEFRIADAGGAEVLGEEACGSRLHLAGIAQRPKRVVEPEEKLQALLVGAELGFRPAVFERRPDTVGDVLRERDLVRGPHARLAAVDPE